MKVSDSRPIIDLLTVIALSMLAYIISIFVHEHLGHTLVCIALGGFPTEIGAFYMDCDYRSMPDLSIRLVALAGPLASWIGGMVSLICFERIPRSNPPLKYFTWLLTTICLMMAAGYLLFSGVGGIGDFGLDRSGIFYQAQPEWVYRIGLSILGVASYLGVIWLCLRKMDTMIGGQGEERVGRAQKLSIISYLTGGLTSILIGLLNPHGILIVLISSASSSLGGTSGLLWMMQMLDRKKNCSSAPLQLERSRSWIIAGFAITLFYTVLFGPTIQP